VPPRELGQCGFVAGSDLLGERDLVRLADRHSSLEQRVTGLGAGFDLGDGLERHASVVRSGAGHRCEPVLWRRVARTTVGARRRSASGQRHLDRLARLPHLREVGEQRCALRGRECADVDRSQRFAERIHRTTELGHRPSSAQRRLH
jgi:hypothetical protein